MDSQWLFAKISVNRPHSRHALHHIQNITYRSKLINGRVCGFKEELRVNWQNCVNSAVTPVWSNKYIFVPTYLSIWRRCVSCRFLLLRRHCPNEKLRWVSSSRSPLGRGYYSHNAPRLLWRNWEPRWWKDRMWLRNPSRSWAWSEDARLTDRGGGEEEKRGGI